MALTSISVHPQQNSQHSNHSTITTAAGSLMGLLLALYLANKTKKQFRKFRRKLFWTAVKTRISSFFHKGTVSDTTLLYILLGALVLALIIISPYWGLAVLALAIIIILLVHGRI